MKIEEKIDKYLKKESIGDKVFGGIGKIRSKYFNTKNIDKVIEIVTNIDLTKIDKYALLKMNGFTKSEVNIIEKIYTTSLKKALDNYGEEYKERDTTNFGGIVYPTINHDKDLVKYLKKHISSQLKNKIKFDK